MKEIITKEQEIYSPKGVIMEEKELRGIILKLLNAYPDKEIAANHIVELIRGLMEIRKEG